MFVCRTLNRCLSAKRAAKGAPISGPIGIGNYRDGAPMAERLPPTRGFYNPLLERFSDLGIVRACRFHYQIGTEQASY
jgi:hypothetical protein